MFDHGTRHRFAAGLAKGAGMFAFLALTVGAASVTRLNSAGAPEASDIVYFCSSCHGAEGRSASSRFPRLAGQQKDYIIAQLQDFRDNTRTAPHAQNYLDYLVMWGLTAQLDAPKTDAIAAFYAAQAPVAGEPAASPEIAAGRKIYTEGIP